MKTQRALRLRQAGKHHWTRARLESERPWAREVRNSLARAFEMDCAPKHSTEPNQEPYTTMDYVTGVYTWHGRIYLHGGVTKYVDIEDMWVTPVYESETS